MAVTDHVLLAIAKALVVAGYMVARTLSGLSVGIELPQALDMVE